MADKNVGLAQDMNPQMGGGPPPFMQGPISPMMTGAPPQAGGVLPPTNPIDATQQGGNIDPAATAAMNQITQTGAQDYSTRAGMAMGPKLGGGLPDLIRQQQEQSGDLSWHPNMVHGQGAGGFFHNLGQALIALGISTTPGRAIESTLYSKPRQEYAGRAKEISELQKQQELTQQPMAAEAQLPFRQAGLQLKSGELDVHQQNADTRAQRVADQASNDLVRQAQGWGRLGVAQQKQQFDQWYKGEVIKVARERIAAGWGENEARVAATKDVAAALQSNKLIQESPIKAQIMDWLGVLPDIQAPAGATTQTTKPGKQQPGGPSKPRASAAAGAPARPANVPPNYVYKKNGPKGEGWYKPSMPGL